MKIVIPIDRPLRFGVVIGTHASIPYVELGLAALFKHEPGVQVLVHDDSSDDMGKLRLMAEKYGADFTSTPSRRVYSTDGKTVLALGDMSALAEGLRWGQEKGLDIVVKLSRRFILNREWTSHLQEIFQNLQYVTATASDARFLFGFRSEIVAMHVNSWIGCGAYHEMAGIVRTNRLIEGLSEAFYHEKARQAHSYAHPKEEMASYAGDATNDQCDYLVRHERAFRRHSSSDAFAVWPMLGLARSQPVPGILWHDFSEPRDYLTLSKEFGLPYVLAAFGIKPGH